MAVEVMRVLCRGEVKVGKMRSWQVKCSEFSASEVKVGKTRSQQVK